MKTKKKKPPNYARAKRALASFFLRDISKHCKDQYKAACARYGKSMKEVLVQFMYDYAEDPQFFNDVVESKKRLKKKLAQQRAQRKVGKVVDE